MVDSLNWASAITWVKAPALVQAAPVNAIVVGGPVVGAPPGFYSTALGDASQVPAGFQITQSGIKYQAVKVGFMGATWWQQVS